MMWDDEGVFLGWATGILFWIFVAWSISCFMIPASLSQHEKGNMMRLRHHICFVWRLLYQAFEIRHDWSLINSFHSLESESSICLKPESWVPPFAGVSKNGSMFLCFHVGQTKKKKHPQRQHTCHFIGMLKWCFQLPMKEVPLHYHPVRCIDDYLEFLLKTRYNISKSKITGFASHCCCPF